MTKKNIFIIFIIICTIILFFLNLPPNKVEDPLLKKIKQEGELIIGTDATYPPMEAIDEDGSFYGLDIDIMKEVAKDLGVEPIFQNVPWEIIFDVVRNGDVDVMISSVTITQERAQTMSFSDPYFNAGQVLIIRSRDSGKIQDINDIAEHKVGIQEGTTSEQEAIKYVEDASLIKNYVDYYLAKDDLMEGEIDIIIADYPGAFGLVKGETDIKIVGDPFTQEFYGIVVQKDQKELLSQINKTIRRLKQDGDLKELEQKWLNQ
ncbi:MAG: transporter substrate-binding domain-containing protein [Patescibacteria group bacterium]